MISKLNPFINELRHTGYNIGTAQFLQVQNLILTLTQRNEMPADLKQLKVLIAPILCQSPQEQTDFYRYFDNWIDRIVAPATSLSKPKSTEKKPKLTEKKLNVFKKLGFSPRLFFILTTIILLIGGISYFLQTQISQPIEDESKEQIDKPTEPIEKEPITSTAQTQETDSATEEPKEQITPPAQTQETETIIIIEQGMTRNDWFIVIASLLFVPLLFLLAWLWQWGRRYRWKRFLTRVTSSEQFDIEKLAIKGVDETIFQPLSINPTVQQFYEQNQIDIEASIEKTVQTGGFPTPVKKASQTLNYLILIDRSTFADHQTKLVEHLITQLSVEGVNLSHYYFDGDPRYCYPPQAQQAPFQISELADRYPRYHLVVFSEGDGLIDPVTGEAVDWINALALWSQRLLFVLAAPEQWGYRERVLEDAGFLILPANEEGLTALIEQIYSPTTNNEGTEFPALLWELPQRWLERQTPDTETLDELLIQLHQFLGDVGYYWLSTCAIYPQLLWPLTLHLGQTLSTTDNHKLITTTRLAQLVRLPWFRQGYMPNWLRERLVGDLSLPQKEAIRIALKNLLATAQEKPAHPFYLEIAQTNWLKSFEREQLLADHVCVTQLAGKLSVEIPQKLREWFKLSSVQPVKPLSTLKLVTMGAMATIILAMVTLLMVTHSPDLKEGQIFRNRLQDGSLGPQMVMIPADTFRMGDIQGEGYDNELPVHEVSVKGFAMGRYEVTVGEFRQFVEATHYKTEAEKGNGCYVFSGDTPGYKEDANWHNPYFSQDDNQPVICVSWDDAMAYTEWLSQQTAQQYRLPTEAEWEYAARAGTETKYWWGNEIGSNQENCDNDDCGDSFEYTAPVGSFAANPYGLYDTMGNVWEWVADNWHENYEGAPTDESVWEGGNESRRVLRGGSWNSFPTIARSTNRNWDYPHVRDDNYGIRVAARNF